MSAAVRRKTPVQVLSESATLGIAISTSGFVPAGISSCDRAGP